MHNEILVAGMDNEENPFVKMVLEYGFKPVHLPYNAPSRELPKCKAAIIVTSNISHELMNRVKAEYSDRKRPILYAKHGTSSIKDEFEQQLVDPIKQILEPLNKKYQVLFLMAYFTKPGTKVYTGDMESLANTYGVNLAQNYISVMFADWTEDGTVEKLVGVGSRGKYVYKGLTEIDCITIQKKTNFNIPPTWLQKKVPETFKPEMVPEIKEQVRVEAPAPAQTLVSADFEKRMEERFEAFEKVFTHKLITLTKAVDVISHSFNPNTRESMIRDINNTLDKMSASELLRIKSMFDLWTK